MSVVATTRLRGVLLALAALVGALGPACQPTPTARPAPAPSATLAPAAPSAAAPDAASRESDIRWLVEHSMLHQAELAARRYSGQGQLWQHPYAMPQPRAASALASVWFTAYPPSQITGPGESVLESLGDPELWRAFREIGIGGMHTGPMKRAGGLRGREYTPTVDGNFDRISSEIDPAFGTEAQYQSMVRQAGDNGAVIIGDVIPGHSGKGADFHLAERRYGDYPGLYHMVEIRPTDWGLLPAVPAGKDSINLGPAAVDALKAAGYIVGRLPRTIFYELTLRPEDMKPMSQGGADLSYDFITRPAYQHALVTGDASFLRVMLDLQRAYQVDPAALVHALQNHDELTLELVHFWTRYKDTTFTFRGKPVKGGALRETIRAEMHARLQGLAAPYNLKAANGISSTTATAAAAALGIRDLGRLTEAQG